MEDPKATDLARTLCVTKPTVSALLARLLQNGYVRKERSHTDARSWHVHLTERGDAVMAAHRAVHETIAAQLVRNLDEAEPHTSAHSSAKWRGRYRMNRTDRLSRSCRVRQGHPARPGFDCHWKQCDNACQINISTNTWIHNRQDTFLNLYGVSCVFS